VESFPTLKNHFQLEGPAMIQKPLSERFCHHRKKNWGFEFAKKARNQAPRPNPSPQATKPKEAENSFVPPSIQETASA